jgi:hypothetical protein
MFGVSLPFSWKTIAIVCGIAVLLLVVRRWWGGRKPEGFQVDAATLPANIPTEMIQQQMDPCKVLKSLHTSITEQIKKGEESATAPAQIELMRMTKGSIEQQMAATNCQ